jgi:hypothetical protein
MNVQITTSTFIQSQDITIITDANIYKIQMKHIYNSKLLRILVQSLSLMLHLNANQKKTYAVKCHLICE